MTASPARPDAANEPDRNAAGMARHQPPIHHRTPVAAAKQPSITSAHAPAPSALGVFAHFSHSRWLHEHRDGHAPCRRIRSTTNARPGSRRQRALPFATNAHQALPDPWLTLWSKQQSPAETDLAPDAAPISGCTSQRSRSTSRPGTTALGRSDRVRAIGVARVWSRRRERPAASSLMTPAIRASASAWRIARAAAPRPDPSRRQRGNGGGEAIAQKSRRCIHTHRVGIA